MCKCDTDAHGIISAMLPVARSMIFDLLMEAPEKVAAAAAAAAATNSQQSSGFAAGGADCAMS